MESSSDNNTLYKQIKLLRFYRGESEILVRGELPKVDFTKERNLQGCLHFILFIFLCIVCAVVYSILLTPLLYVIFYIISISLEVSDKREANDGKLNREVLKDSKFLYKGVLIALIPLFDKMGWMEEVNNEPQKNPTVRLLQTPGIWIGKSTGKLSELWHETGIAPNQHITLPLDDAYKNILVLGGIGSGKTSCVMQPILAQAFDLGWGGLIFDIKGDVKNVVVSIALATAKQNKLIIIGPKQQSINLISGLTPEIAASFLKSAFLLSGYSMDSFWIDTASELCRNTLGMLLFIPKRYSLQHLYEYLFDKEAKALIDGELFKVQSKLSLEEKRLLNTYSRYVETIFENFDAKVKSGVMATVSQALSPFNHPDLLDAFCSSSNDTLQMKNILDGTVYLVDIPLALWGLGGKVAYTFIKLRFFNLMQNRYINSAWDQKRPVLFMCDEYQEIISANKDGLSDLNFWDKSRSSKTIGVISSQSVASFYAALNNTHVADALLQNFRQKICLKTEDKLTLNFMRDMVGNAVTRKLTVSKNYSSQSAGSAPTPHLNNEQSHTSENIVETKEAVIDAQLFRKLTMGFAVAVLTIDGHSMDDVIQLMPMNVH